MEFWLIAVLFGGLLGIITELAGIKAALNRSIAATEKLTEAVNYPLRQLQWLVEHERLVAEGRQEMAKANEIAARIKAGEWRSPGSNS